MKTNRNPKQVSESLVVNQTYTLSELIKILNDPERRKTVDQSRLDSCLDSFKDIDKEVNKISKTKNGRLILKLKIFMAWASVKNE